MASSPSLPSPGHQPAHQRGIAGLGKLPADLDTADALAETQQLKHGGRDVHVAGRAAGAPVSNLGLDCVAAGAVDGDGLAAHGAVVGVVIGAVVCGRQGGDVLEG